MTSRPPLPLPDAVAYSAAGLCVIPVAADGTKRPVLPSWKPYQTRPPTPAELTRWFSGGSVGVAVVAGAVSGGLEVIDCDDADTALAWMEGVERRRPGLLGRLPQVVTPRPGLHVYIRRPAARGSRKLAQAADPDTGRPKVLVETRGEGAYVIAPPSPPACHPSGRPYQLLDGPPLTAVPLVTDHEYAALVAAAEALNRLTLTPSPPPVRTPSRRTGTRPGDRFDALAGWADVLMPHGWRWVGEAADGTGYWRRPGKRTGVSATTDHGGSGRLYVFSSSAWPLEPGRWYTKFAAHALLAFGGDFAAAARAVGRSPTGRLSRR